MSTINPAEAATAIGVSAITGDNPQIPVSFNMRREIHDSPKPEVQSGTAIGQMRSEMTPLVAEHEKTTQQGIPKSEYEVQEELKKLRFTQDKYLPYFATPEAISMAQQTALVEHGVREEVMHQMGVTYDELQKPDRDGKSTSLKGEIEKKVNEKMLQLARTWVDIYGLKQPQPEDGIFMAALERTLAKIKELGLHQEVKRLGKIGEERTTSPAETSSTESVK